jgi:hypothetical protein
LIYCCKQAACDIQCSTAAVVHIEKYMWRNAATQACQNTTSCSSLNSRTQVPAEGST